MTLGNGWRAVDLSRLRGRVALVTGASSGVGLAIAQRLAAEGVRTLLGCRDRGRAQQARELILNRSPRAAVEIVLLDLASLESVQDAAAEVADLTGRLDLLVNNAGVMAVRPGRTAEGFEIQLGTNHLGHFALTGRLLPLLLAAGDARVVTQTSVAHRLATSAGLSEAAAFTELPHDSRWLGYCRSKLANLLFTLELDRRWKAYAAMLSPDEQGQSLIRSFPVHPGVARTELVEKTSLGRRPLVGQLGQAGFDAVGQSAADGALPALYAATRSELGGGEFIGPRGLPELRGAPGVVRPSRLGRDLRLAARLWAASAEATGVGYEELRTRVGAV
ncbi:MAG TPA: SDR family NAD(P)-dependent oxidoreductase [Actinocrinis sp.]|nr:SDR family NAD(P)-dependent oxidoreductase [Actinocrinis sp.]